MKNIFLIQTDKPSRLYEFGGNYHLQEIPKENFRSHNIYITNSEEIKEGDWVVENHTFKREPYIGKCFYPKNDGTVTDEILKRDLLSVKYEGHYETLALKHNCKKIILTTDQDLIKDGVQAIDDEFLEWFVKNSSCEWVEVRYTVDFNSKAVIIIPKEEPKQETTLEEAALNIIPDRTSAGWIDCFGATERIGFIKGANYQAKRSYSEEEVLQALNIGFTSTDETWDECVEFAKEQFKKK
jgi:hypothetical protein